MAYLFSWMGHCWFLDKLGGRAERMRLFSDRICTKGKKDTKIAIIQLFSVWIWIYLMPLATC